MNKTPFSSSVVINPRRIKLSVPELNEKVLTEVFERFDALCTTDLPRARLTGPRMVLFGSPAVGYGKSHLIGRLFERTTGRGFGIYLRPFEDPVQPWVSILLTTIQELLRPEAGKSTSNLRGFARRILGRLMAMFIEENNANEEAFLVAARKLRTAPEDLFEHSEDGSQWRDWFVSNFQEAGPHLPEFLIQQGLNLDGREDSWVKALFACGFLSGNGAHDLHQRVALKWLRAEALDKLETTLLGINPADNDGHPEDGPEQRNELARRRFRDLLELARFDRPFLICFDQTEAYSRSPALASTFGAVIEHLVEEVPNHLAVAAVNQGQWFEKLLGSIKPSLRNQLSELFLLEGIDRKLGRALIEMRLAEAKISPKDADAFLRQDWLESFFNKTPQPSPQRLLGLAEEKWRIFKGLPSVPEISSTTFFDQFLADTRAESRGENPLFQLDDLNWLISTLGYPEHGEVISVEGNRHFSTVWRDGGRSIYLALEPGDNLQRWQSIVAEARRLIPTPTSKECQCIVIRTSDLPQIPKPTWKAAGDDILQVMDKLLSIFILQVSQVEALRAARILDLESSAAGIPFPRETVIDWIRKALWGIIQSLFPPGISSGIASDTKKKSSATAQTGSHALDVPVPFTPLDQILETAQSPNGKGSSNLSIATTKDSDSSAAIPKELPPNPAPRRPVIAISTVTKPVKMIASKKSGDIKPFSSEKKSEVHHKAPAIFRRTLIPRTSTKTPGLISAGRLVASKQPPEIKDENHQRVSLLSVALLEQMARHQSGQIGSGTESALASATPDQSTIPQQASGKRMADLLLKKLFTQSYRGQSNEGAPTKLGIKPALLRPSGSAPGIREKMPLWLCAPMRRHIVEPSLRDAARIVEAVREARFIALPDLLSKLSPPVACEVVLATLERHPNVTVFGEQNNLVYQWQQDV